MTRARLRREEAPDVEALVLPRLQELADGVDLDEGPAHRCSCSAPLGGCRSSPAAPTAARRSRHPARRPPGPARRHRGAARGPLVAERLRTEQEAALAELEAAGAGRCCDADVERLWRHASEGRGELLVVEEGFAAPALVDPSGAVRPAADPEHPEVVDDLVDELVEAVMARRGRAVFVPDGALTDHGRAALVLRY